MLFFFCTSSTCSTCIHSSSPSWPNSFSVSCSISFSMLVSLLVPFFVSTSSSFGLSGSPSCVFSSTTLLASRSSFSFCCSYDERHRPYQTWLVRRPSSRTWAGDGTCLMSSTPHTSLLGPQHEPTGGLAHGGRHAGRLSPCPCQREGQRECPADSRPRTFAAGQCDSSSVGCYSGELVSRPGSSVASAWHGGTQTACCSGGWQSSCRL